MKAVLSKFASTVARPEDGVALPLTMSVLLIAGLLGAAAMVASNSSVHQSTRDRSVKRAVQTADAGIDIAANRLNKLATVSVLDDSKQCVVASGGTLATEAVQADGWCRVQTETLEDNATYSYRVSGRQQAIIAGKSVWQRKIVSTGAVSGVQRRAAGVLTAEADAPLFPQGVFSDRDYNQDGNSTVESDVGSNGDVNVNNPQAEICGDVVVGPDGEQNGDKNCEGSVSEAEEEVFLNPIVVPTANDNANLSNGTDPMSGGVSWNENTRVLTVDDGTLTLKGSVYVLCSLHVNGNSGRIIIENDGTPVKIYIDDPQNCTTGDPSRGSVLFEQKGKIDTGGNPWLAQVYMVGNPDIPTSFSLQNNTKEGVEVTLYAPRSSFSISNNGLLIGAIAAKSVSVSGNSEIRFDSSVSSVTNPALHYEQEAWVECRLATPADTAPDMGC